MDLVLLFVEVAVGVGPWSVEKDGCECEAVCDLAMVDVGYSADEGSCYGCMLDDADCCDTVLNGSVGVAVGGPYSSAQPANIYGSSDKVVVDAWW